MKKKFRFNKCTRYFASFLFLIAVEIYLIVSSESLLLGEFSGNAFSCRCFQSVGSGAVQGEGLSVHRHTHDQLLLVCPLLGPVVHAEVLERSYYSF